MLHTLIDKLLLAQDDAVPTAIVKDLVEAVDAIQTPLPGVRWDNIGYLVAAVLFILGIRGMTHPRTAVRGNLMGALGMLLAVVVTLLKTDVGLPIMLAGMVIGAAAGLWFATKVQMTQMPQLVALFNGFGGIASVLVAGAEMLKEMPALVDSSVTGVAAGLTGLIGSVTFTGSLVAAGKLQELSLFKKPFSFSGQKIVNAILFCIALALIIAMRDGTAAEFFPLVFVALVLGVLLVTPIGGADMPVVIALLNSYSGLAASAAGFIINNNVLIIAGALVGASGLILTSIMCKAMNRPLTNVLFGTMEVGSDAPDADEVYAGKIKSTSAEEVAMLLDGVQRVVIVPGYGLAVAQAQHVVRDLANLLESKGVTVEYAIHPVAGRMPGHMNVLLAEADVPYELLKEMDEINPTFAQCDVAIVLGANDVVNPVADTDPNSPIAGMPILNVHEARTGRGYQTEPEPRFRRHSQPAIRRRQLSHAFR